jgi:hypothetical protein
LSSFLEAKKPEWSHAYAGTLEKPKSDTAFACFTLDLPRPAMGDQKAIKAVFDRVELMASALLPLIDSFFANGART